MNLPRAICAATCLALLAASATADGPYLPGSVIVPAFSRVVPPYTLSVAGPGSIRDGAFVAPPVGAATTTTVIASGANGQIGERDLRLAPAPRAGTAVIAVATYDGGVVLHDPTTFAVVGTIATGGSPSDVAVSADGTMLATDTAGDAATRIARAPWTVARIAGVPLGNEVLADAAGDTFFVSDRDAGGRGAVTRIAADGTTSRTVTGDTAEGLALDAARRIVYVGNINDGTVLAVDADTLAPIRRVTAVPRVFGIALSRDGDTLYAVANQSVQARSLAHAGYVASIPLRGRGARRRSADLRFPLGAALDGATGRLFVTDEAADEIYVLNAATLRASHRPLPTCRTPWKPLLSGSRLYIPCARADAVDVYDVRTLRRIAGAPFATGGYPLGVAIWRPR